MSLIVRAGVALVVLLGVGAGWWMQKSPPRPQAGANAPSVSASATDAAPMAAPAVASAAGPQAVVASAPAGWQAPTPGSEGYGPHIQRALDGTDAQLALWAARRIQECESIVERTNAVHKARSQLDGTQDGLAARVITGVEAEARRCQTVTADLKSQDTELARRAAKAGIAGAATVFGQSIRSGNVEMLRNEALGYLREAALRADGNALRSMAEAAPGYYATDVARQAYAWAYEHRWGTGISDDPSLLNSLPVFSEVMVAHMPPDWKPQLDATQQAQARQLADALIAKWKNLPPPQRRGS